jgi:hypothetical protein
MPVAPKSAKTQAGAEEAARVAEGIGFNLNPEDTMAGFEGVTQETMALPFLRIMQKLTPELDENVPEKYIEGSKEGMLFNTATKTLYGWGMQIVCLKFDRVFIEWKGKKKDRGGFLGVHDPENAERIAKDKTWGEWLTADGNFLQENYVYMVISPGHETDGLMVLSLTSSAIKVAREWNVAMTRRTIPSGPNAGKIAMPYYQIYDLSTTRRENDQGAWFAPVLKFGGFVSEAQYKLASQERLALPTRQVDYKQLENQGGGEGGVDTGEGEF